MVTQFVSRHVGTTRGTVLDIRGGARHIRVSPDPSGTGALVEVWSVAAQGALIDRQYVYLPECCIVEVASELLSAYAIPDEQTPEQREAERVERDLVDWSTLREPVEVDDV